MDEAPIAHIDAGMTDLRAAIGGEEHQVAALQRIDADTRGAHGDELAGGARQADAGGVAVDVTDQAAAVETAVRGVAAPAVGRADQAQRAKQHVVGNGRELWRRRGDDGRGRRRLARASGEQRSQGKDGEAVRCEHGKSVLT
ncbi:hypothetical protein D3C81_1886900 [compost metagenome]